VFFRQVNSELVQDFACVARQTAEQCTVAVHHNEAEFAIVGQQSCQRLHVKQTELIIILGSAQKWLLYGDSLNRL